MTKRGQASDSTMKYLTLTFNLDNVGRSFTGPRPKTRNGTRSPGFAPSAKHYVKSTSSQRHGASPQNTTRNYYQQKLNSDIDRLLIEDKPVKSSSPKWTRARNKPASASNSVTKEDHLKEYLRIAQSLSPNSLLTSRVSSSISAHSFLIDDLQNRPCTEINDKLGRPTRTTLLRNRQRSNSAPVTSYETREEIKRRNQLRMEHRNRPHTAVGNKESYTSQESIEGESLHAFLTGARYNRAHCVDAMSLLKYGVYMPRGNPRACFVNESRSKPPVSGVSKQENIIPPVSSEVPMDSHSLDSAMSEVVDETDNTTRAPPSTPAAQMPHFIPTQQSSASLSETLSQPGPVWPSSGKQAWDDSSATVTDTESISKYASSSGPKLNITGRKMTYSSSSRPLSASYQHACETESTPPPPPSVDFCSHLHLDLSASPAFRLRAQGDHNRAVRFCEPDDLGVLGKAITSPNDSPKHYRSAPKLEEPIRVAEAESVRFFMTEDPETTAEVDIPKNVTEAEIKVSATVEAEIVHGEAENVELVAEEKRNKQEEVIDVMIDLSSQWMQEAGLSATAEMEGEDIEDEDEDRATTPMHITAVDIARKPSS